MVCSQTKNTIFSIWVEMNCLFYWSFEGYSYGMDFVSKIFYSFEFDLIWPKNIRNS